MQKSAALVLLLISVPIWPILYLAVKLTSPGPFIFKQKRAGKNKKPFTIYKIRTMVIDAEKLKKNYLRLNEADGPVFKIKNDPRYTKVGKILAKLAVDELPQLINIIKGEMEIVGPRPLPLDEARKVPKKYWARFTVLPGMTSPWIVKGGHSLTFEKWMELDLQYVNQKSVLLDVKVFLKTAVLMLKNLIALLG